jgi:hypothetical protein
MTDTIIQNIQELSIIQVVEDKIIQNINETSSIIEVSGDTVLTESNNPIIIQTFEGPEGPEGPTGPQGPAGGEDVALSKQVDFIDDNHIYIGEANPGSTFSAAVWRIKYIVILSDGDVSITWADGDDSFDNVWNNRASYSYS